MRSQYGTIDGYFTDGLEIDPSTIANLRSTLRA